MSGRQLIDPYSDAERGGHGSIGSEISSGTPPTSQKGTSGGAGEPGAATPRTPPIRKAGVVDIWGARSEPVPILKGRVSPAQGEVLAFLDRGFLAGADFLFLSGELAALPSRSTRFRSRWAQPLQVS